MNKRRKAKRELEQRVAEEELKRRLKVPRYEDGKESYPDVKKLVMGDNIMPIYEQYLEDGMTPDEALSSAKRHYDLYVKSNSYNEYESFYAGLLPEVVVKPDYNKKYLVDLVTHYPSKLWPIGHSELVTPGGNRISAGFDDNAYNLVLNNCSDATISALSQAFGTNQGWHLINTPGSAKEFAEKRLGGISYVEPDDNPYYNNATNTYIPATISQLLTLAKFAKKLRRTGQYADGKTTWNYYDSNGNRVLPTVDANGNVLLTINLSGVAPVVTMYRDKLPLNSNRKVVLGWDGNGNRYTQEVFEPDFVQSPTEAMRSGLSVNWLNSRGANNLFKTGLDFAPVIGDALQAYDAAKDAFSGNYTKAGINAAMLLLPNALEKPVSKIIKELPIDPMRYYRHVGDDALESYKASGLVSNRLPDGSKAGYYDVPMFSKGEPSASRLGEDGVWIISKPDSKLDWQSVKGGAISPTINGEFNKAPISYFEFYKTVPGGGFIKLNENLMLPEGFVMPKKVSHVDFLNSLNEQQQIEYLTKQGLDEGWLWTLKNNPEWLETTLKDKPVGFKNGKAANIKLPKYADGKSKYKIQLNGLVNPQNFYFDEEGNIVLDNGTVGTLTLPEVSIRPNLDVINAINRRINRLASHTERTNYYNDGMKNPISGDVFYPHAGGLEPVYPEFDILSLGPLWKFGANVGYNYTKNAANNLWNSSYGQYLRYPIGKLKLGNFVPTLDDNLAGIRYAYDRNPELANIGTLEEYNNYLKTVFPESKVKDVNYHMGPKGLQELKPSTGEIWNTNPDARGIYVTPDKSYAQRIRKFTTDRLEKPSIWTYLKRNLTPGGWDKANEAFTDIYPVLIDTRNPLYTKGTWTWGIKDKKYQSLMEEYDAIVNSGPKWYQNVNSMPESIVPRTEQSLILGSDADIAGFRKFMSPYKQITAENAASITPEQWNAAYRAAYERGDKAEGQRLWDLWFKTKTSDNKMPAPEGWHQTNTDFNVFDLNRSNNKNLDALGIIGVYTKNTNADILGTQYPNQMHIYRYAKNPLEINTKTDLLEMVPGLKEKVQEYKNIEDTRKSLIGLITERSNPNTTAIRKAEINEQIQAFQNEYHRQLSKVIEDNKALIDKYLKDNNFDAVLINKDYSGDGLHNFGRYTDTEVLLSPNQIKSAEPFTLADDGSLIPLTERANFNINDRRYGLLPFLGLGAAGTLLSAPQYGYKYGKASGIHIKPENRGKFTALKKRTGHSTSWFKKNGTPAQKKMATFALNAKKWNHKKS